MCLKPGFEKVQAKTLGVRKEVYRCSLIKSRRRRNPMYRLWSALGLIHRVTHQYEHEISRCSSHYRSR